MWSRSPSKILIVSDSEAGSNLTPSFLHQRDIRLLDARPGADAISRARDLSPTLIVHNLTEPIDESLQVVRRLKGDPSTRSIPLIAVAAKQDDEPARSAGANIVLTRPLVQREYWDAVRKFVRLPKRRDLRQTINLRFTYRWDGNTGQAFSRDLSLYGAFLKTDHLLPNGKRIVVEFHIPGDAAPVQCAAVVRRSTPYDPHRPQAAGFAIEFEGLEGASLRRFERFVGRHMRRTLFSLITGWA